MKVGASLILIFLIGIIKGQSSYEVNWEYSGEIPVEAFGWAMCTAGDVNGDGYPDVLVAAIDHSDPIETEEEEGKLYLFYGGPDGLSTTPDWSYEPNDDLTILGFDVAGGDLNGDGYSDIVAGNLQWTGDISEQGKISLWYGGPDGPGDAPDWEYEGDQVQGLMGSSVAMESDINMDGYNDLFISAKMHDNPELNEGKIWMFWGSADGPVGPVWSYEPNQDGVVAGFPVEYAGDVNGDGYPDVIIGASNYTNTINKQGMAVVFYGGPDSLSTEPNWAAYGENNKDFFGHWVDGAGDVNGDGFDDVIIAAISYERDGTLVSEGTAYVYHGSAEGLEATPSWQTFGNQSGANYGYCVSGAGDVNGDGFDEVIVGAKYWSNPENKEGSASVFWGSPNGLEENYCFFLEGGQDSAYLGRHVDGGADFNNDGYSDFLAGAYRYSNVFDQDGIVYGVYGGPREADFHFDVDSICIEGANPTPIIDGMEGGTFYGSAGVTVDSETGEVDLLSSSLAWNKIYYEYNNGWCTVTDSVGLFIVPQANSEFAYPVDTIFTDDEMVTPGISEPSANNTFSAIPAGLDIDPETGSIIPESSLPETYTITNITNNGYCFDTSELIIYVIEPCLQPANPVVEEITETTAVAHWTPASENESSYNVWVYTLTDTTFEEGYTDTVITFSGLEPATTYRVKVQASCNSGLLSPESGQTVFETLQVVSILSPDGQSVNIYPNPADQSIILDFKHPTENDGFIELVNMLGIAVKRVNLPSNTEQFILPIEMLPSGNYLLQLNTANEIRSVVVQVKH